MKKSQKRETPMTNKVSQCIICSQYFQSKKELRNHKDKNHRVTDTKIVQLNGLIPSDNNN
jgi:hypothetical protein